MKLAVALGLVLMVVFAIIVVAPMIGLQEEAGGLGLSAPASSIFGNVGNLAVLLSGVIALIFLFATITYVVRQR